MAWLLHEPRLVAKVPVFCIIGVRPLLKNPLAPLSVSVGAVHLLTHLHGRLEVGFDARKRIYRTQNNPFCTSLFATYRC